MIAEQGADARKTARDYYRGSGRNVKDDIAAHLLKGVVVWTPGLAAMARPVRLEWGDRRVANPFYDERGAEYDAWFVHLLCGDLRLASGLAGDMLRFPHIVFQRGLRGSRLRVVEPERFLKRIAGK